MVFKVRIYCIPARILDRAFQRLDVALRDNFSPFRFHAACVHRLYQITLFQLKMQWLSRTTIRYLTDALAVTVAGLSTECLPELRAGKH